MPSIHLDEPLIDLDKIQTRSLDSLVEIFHKISDDDQVSSRKHLLILERQLSKYINRLAPFSSLQSQTGIDKVVWLEDTVSGPLEMLQEYKSVVFMASDSIPNIENIAQVCKSKILPFDVGIKVSIIFPSSNTRFDNLMVETLNLKGDVDVYNWSMMRPIKLADDLVVLDNDQDLKQLYDANCVTSVTELSQTLLQLVLMSDFKLRFTNVFTKGELSSFFQQTFEKNFDVYLKDELNLEQQKLLQEIDDVLFFDKHSFYNKQCDLVVLERSVDLVTPLLVQLTYAGLIDEFYGLDLNELKFHPNDKELFHKNMQDDALFESIKDLNFSQVGPILNKQAKALQDEFDKRHAAKDIKEIKKFVDRLNDLTAEQNAIKDHTLIAEEILRKVRESQEDGEEEIKYPIDGDDEDQEDDGTYFSRFVYLQQQILSNSFDNTTNYSKLIEFMYAFKPPFEDFIKLVMLTSIVKRGIRAKEYHGLRKEILENYGFEKFPVLQKLTGLNLFHVRDTSNDLNLFASLENSASLVSGAGVATDLDVNGKETLKAVAQQIKNLSQVVYYLNLVPQGSGVGNGPGSPDNDPDFVLPGYIPIVARLVECIYSRDFTAASAMKTPSNLLKPGWDKVEGVLGKYFHQGTPFKDKLLVPENKRQIFGETPQLSSSAGKSKQTRNTEYIVLVMIGGITHAELAAVRHIVAKINSTKGYKKKLLVLTNAVISSNDVVGISS